MGTECAFLCVADKLKTSELPVPDGNVNSYENKIKYCLQHGEGKKPPAIRTGCLQVLL